VGEGGELIQLPVVVIVPPLSVMVSFRTAIAPIALSSPRVLIVTSFTITEPGSSARPLAVSAAETFVPEVPAAMHGALIWLLAPVSGNACCQNWRCVSPAQNPLPPAAIAAWPRTSAHCESLPNSSRHDHKRRVVKCRVCSCVKPMAP
jgi:hypothetical protein